MKRGPLIILSGPSGSGKSSVIKRLLGDPSLPLHLSVSATTRPRREGEVEGVHYRFWTREQFLTERERGGFLEWAEVYGNLYGTPCSEVNPHREAGTGVLLDVDVQGAKQVRQCCQDSVSFFLMPPSEAELERRLRQRGSEDETSLQRRLKAARAEMDHAGEYDYRVTNDDVEGASASVRALIAELFQRGNHAG